MNTDILGRGFSTPLQVNDRGGVREAKHGEKVKQAIAVILGTQRGERVMRPGFGCNLRSLVFAPNNAATANLARHYVEEGLATWEPRIIVDSVRVENDNEGGRLLVHIEYRLKSTFEAQNLVFPFYLQPV